MCYYCLVTIICDYTKNFGAQSIVVDLLMLIKSMRKRTSDVIVVLSHNTHLIEHSFKEKYFEYWGGQTAYYEIYFVFGAPSFSNYMVSSNFKCLSFIFDTF